MSNVRLRWKRIGRNPSCGFETGIIEAMAAEVAACGVRWRALSVGGIYRLDPSNQKPVARHIWQCGKLIFKKGRSGGGGRIWPGMGSFTLRFKSLAPTMVGSCDSFKTHACHPSGRLWPELDDTMGFESWSLGAHFGPVPGP